MKVKIIKSKLPTMWYVDKIGEMFEVGEHIDSSDMYKVKQSKKYSPTFIYAEDTQTIKYYNEILRNLADKIENLRIEIYSQSHTDLDDYKQEADDKLFSIQSQLREVAKVIGYYEEE